MGQGVWKIIWDTIANTWSIADNLFSAFQINFLLLGIFIVASIIRFIINPALKEKAK